MTIDESKYKLKVSFPRKRDYIKYMVTTLNGEYIGNYYSKDELEKQVGIAQQAVRKKIDYNINKSFNEIHCSAIIGNMVVVGTFWKEKYNEDIKAYRDEAKQLANQFFIDCCSKIGLDAYSKEANVIFTYAYEEGHGYGTTEIFNWMEYLSDFLDEIDCARSKSN